MRRRIAALAAALMAALGATVVVAESAQAHTQWGCNHGSACLHREYDGGGLKYTIIWSTTPHNTCVNLPASWRNNASSATADFGSGWDLMLFEDLDCDDFWGGDRLTSPESWNFNGIHGYLDNDVESFKILL